MKQTVRIFNGPTSAAERDQTLLRHQTSEQPLKLLPFPNVPDNINLLDDGSFRISIII